MTSSKHSTVKKAQSAIRKHGKAVSKAPVAGLGSEFSPPPSSPPVPQRFAAVGSSSDLPEFPAYLTKLSAYERASPVTGDTSRLSPSLSDKPSESAPVNTNTSGSDAYNMSKREANDMDLGAPDLTIRNGVYWDTKLNCEARPISKPAQETTDTGSIPNVNSKCICGKPKGGMRVSQRYAKRYEYKGPKFVFDEKKGLYKAAGVSSLATPFHHFQIDGKDIFQPITITREAYLAGERGAHLSAERSVPICAHFPVTGLRVYNAPFVKGRMAHRPPSAQCMTSREQDQARLLMLIEDEERPDGTMRRRMNVHAPPADWNDGASISALNRWRSQFRQRKLGITSREARLKWSDDALNYIVERLARDPSVIKHDLSVDVTRRFKVKRTEHAVTCAIDNHMLRARAENLREQWEEENLQEMMFGGGDKDIDVDSVLESEDDEMEDEEGKQEIDSDDVQHSSLFSSPGKVNTKEFYRTIKMEEWSI